jgi:hypothetical protein
MPRHAIIPLLFLLTSAAFTTWSIVHVIPRIRGLSRRDALLWLVMPHTMRHIGAMALYPGLTDLPDAWTIPLAIGDAATSLLAMASMLALHARARFAIGLTWVFNVFGLADLLHNAYGAAAMELGPRLGVIAYVVAFGVPVMLGFHVLVFFALLRLPERAP